MAVVVTHCNPSHLAICFYFIICIFSSSHSGSESEVEFSESDRSLSTAIGDMMTRLGVADLVLEV